MRLKKSLNKHNHLSLQKILDDYNINYDDDDYMFKLKSIINTLNDLDKTILLLYADLGSLYKVGKTLKVSATTIYINIRRIRQQIKQKLEEEGGEEGL